MPTSPSVPSEPVRDATREPPRHDREADPRDDLRTEIVALAETLGFAAVGFARADVPLARDYERFETFVARGFAGELDYLVASPEARRTVDGESILPGARTVVSFALAYGRGADEEAGDPALLQGVARYARGRDYHNVLRKKLRKVTKLIKRRVPGAAARPLCDVEPILERAWAARAGVGFVGKNGLVIVPRRGSFVLLGEIVTTVAMAPDTPMTERCGSCRACLDACPTDAFDAPWVLDPRKCVSYWSIEMPGTPPAEMVPVLGEHLFGCDACQTACPWNKAAEGPCTWSSPLPTLDGVDVDTVVAMDDAAFDRAFEGSPMKRATRAGVQRNAVLVAASRLGRNRSDAAAARALDAARVHPEPLVRDTFALAATLPASTVPAATAPRTEGGR